jgi:hypothetical protein
VQSGRVIEQQQDAGGASSQLCLACGRRAVLDWADSRKAEATAARQLAHGLGQAQITAADQPRLLVA